MGLHVLAAIVAKILGNYPPEGVVEIGMHGRLPYIADRDMPKNQVWIIDPRFYDWRPL